MIDSSLLEQVKRKLNVTWDDSQTERRIEEIIDEAIPDLIHRLGIADKNYRFDEPGAEQNLLKNYVLYEWNHSLNEFFENYAEPIAQIRAKNEVKSFHESEEDK